MAILREGPWLIRRTNLPCSTEVAIINTFVGDQHEYEFEAVDGNGNVLDLTGYSLSGAVYNTATGNVYLSSQTITGDYLAGGRVSWKPSIAWLSAGNYRFSISATAIGETVILGGVTINVLYR